MEKLGVGIVGIGHAGREHFKAFEENPYAEVRAVWASGGARFAPGEEGYLFLA